MNGEYDPKSVHVLRGLPGAFDRLAEHLRIIERRVGDHGLLYDVYLDGRLEHSMRMAPGLTDEERRRHAAERLRQIGHVFDGSRQNPRCNQPNGEGT